MSIFRIHCFDRQTNRQLLLAECDQKETISDHNGCPGRRYRIYGVYEFADDTIFPQEVDEEWIRRHHARRNEFVHQNDSHRKNLWIRTRIVNLYGNGKTFAEIYALAERQFANEVNAFQTIAYVDDPARNQERKII